MTKAYITSNRFVSKDFVDYSNAFLSAYAIFKKQLENLSDSTENIDDMLKRVSKQLMGTK